MREKRNVCLGSAFVKRIVTSAGYTWYCKYYIQKLVCELLQPSELQYFCSYLTDFKISHDLGILRGVIETLDHRKEVNSQYTHTDSTHRFNVVITGYKKILKSCLL